MSDSENSRAIDSILDMLSLADDDTLRLFPPTELYSEGWMLRLVLAAAKRGVNCLPAPIAAEARWYSEARLESPFMRKSKSASSHLAEGFTHADAIVGHFRFRDHTEAGIELAPGAKQFVVTEAKMFSSLSRGTTNARHYDQAARNVACMAQVLHRSNHRPCELDSLAFYVLAPMEQLERESSFQEWTDRQSIIEKVRERVSEFKCDPERHEDLVRWLDRFFTPMMERIEISCVPWEDVIGRIPEADRHDRNAIEAFYERCLYYNRGAGRG